MVAGILHEDVPARADGRPLYLRIRDQITNLILSGRCQDGDSLPSVRSLAAETSANPLTVAKAYQSLIESGVIEMRRGVGFFVVSGGRSKLCLMERTRFLTDRWPAIAAEIRTLNLDVRELLEQPVGKLPETRSRTVRKGS